MIAPTKIGKYEIRRQIGRGAMGIVYEAFDTVIERRVAIKTLRLDIFDPSQTADVRTRFKREAQSAGQLAHPHIVTVFDYGDHEGTPYIVMEYLAGKELSQILGRGARLPLSEVVRLMNQLLGALSYAHERKVVHRDVKPGNIFILDDGSLKVVDFGLAHVEASNLTDTGALLGTPAYMSPEQFLALPVDERSDIFSAGVILYELLTGDKPFTGTVTSIMQKVLRQEPMEPSVLNPTISTAWDMVVKRAMAKKPDARFQSARQFSETIKQIFEKGSLNVSVEVTLTGAKATELGVEKPQADAVGVSRQAPERKVGPNGAHSIAERNREHSPERRPFAGAGMVVLVGAAIALAFTFWNYGSGQKSPEPAAAMTDAERDAKAKADVEKAAQDQLTIEKLVNEEAAKRDTAAAEKAAFEKAVEERVTRERAMQDKTSEAKRAAEKALTEKVAAEKAARIAEDEAKKKAAAEVARLETLRLQKEEAERVAAEKASAEKEKQSAQSVERTQAPRTQLPPCPRPYNRATWTNCVGTSPYTDNGGGYVGEYKDGMRTGQGTHTYPSGEKYIGEVKNGNRNGKGTLFGLDGSVLQSGNWENGKFIGGPNVDSQSKEKAAKVAKNEKRENVGAMPELEEPDARARFLSPRWRFGLV